MQSYDFVEGISGWRMSKGKIEMYGGPHQVILGQLDGDVDPRPADPVPFSVTVDGQVYINQAFIQDNAITNAKIVPEWSVKLELHNGKYVATGIGMGIDSQLIVSADRFAVDAKSTLDLIARSISETAPCAALKGAPPPSIADQVRDVIRAEIQPGGLLHRPR
jgi:hypothetical protein